MKMATPAEFAGAPTSPPPSGFTGFLPGFFFVCTGLLSLSWCRFNGSVLMSSINANSMSLITATVFDWKKKTKNKRSTAIINQVESFQVVPQKRFAGFSFCLTFWWQVGQQTTFLVFIFLVKYKKKRKKKKKEPASPSRSFLSSVFSHFLSSSLSFLFAFLSLSLSLSPHPPPSLHTHSFVFLSFGLGFYHHRLFLFRFRFPTRWESDDLFTALYRVFLRFFFLLCCWNHKLCGRLFLFVWRSSFVRARPDQVGSRNTEIRSNRKIDNQSFSEFFFYFFIFHKKKTQFYQQKKNWFLFTEVDVLTTCTSFWFSFVVGFYLIWLCWTMFY